MSSHGRSRHSHHAHHSQFRPHNNANNHNTGKWSCVECTFLNSASKTRCDMCLTAKPIQVQNTTDIIIPNGNGNGNVISNVSSAAKNQGIKFTYNPPHPSPHKNGYGHKNHSHDQDKTEISHKPKHSMIPQHVVFNPKKPILKQSIFERWMIAQIERQSGQQPSILTENNLMLTNLRRVRAPTTCRTLQQQINENTNVVTHANNLDAGDFTDDEEDELSSMYPSQSPRSHNNGFGFSPTPSDNEEPDDFSLTPQTPQTYSYRNKLDSKQAQAASQHQLFGRRRNEIMNDAYESKQNSTQNNTQNNKQPSRHIQRYFSTDDATKFTYEHKKLLDKRRRKKKKHKKHTVSLLWFRAQAQLKEGRNPQILNKYNITMTNIRQHNPRFRDYQRRKSQHEKAATYLQVTGGNLTNNRNHIANDDDEVEDGMTDTENDNDYSYPNTPNTPSITNPSFNSQFEEYNPNHGQYVE